eukprot:81304_1
MTFGWFEGIPIQRNVAIILARCIASVSDHVHRSFDLYPHSLCVISVCLHVKSDDVSTYKQSFIVISMEMRFVHLNPRSASISHFLFETRLFPIFHFLSVYPTPTNQDDCSLHIPSGACSNPRVKRTTQFE